MYSLIIKNAQIIDGTGKPPFQGDMAVEQDQIVAIAPEIKSAGETVIDARGMVLAPGFIDIQNHSDSHWQIFDNPGLESMVTQGYTTLLVGNSGASLAPIISEDSLLALQKWHTLQGANINWQTFAELVKVLKAQSFGCNIASLVGYSTLRRGLVGNRIAPLSVPELQSLLAIIDQSLNEGAFGVSTGLSYAHEVVISEIELFEIAKIVAKNEALMSIHLRNEYDGIMDSVREVIAITEQSKVNMKISHLKIRHSSNWSFSKEVLDDLETAHSRGLNIHFDTYPYNFTWQPLYSYLPTWVIQGGREHIIQTLKDGEQRAKIKQYLVNAQFDVKSFMIASTSTSMHVTGRKMSTIAADMGTTSEEAMLQIIENGGSEVLVFDESLDNNVVYNLCDHGLGFIGTNGSGYGIADKKRLVHPRCFGTAPRFLNHVARDKTISLHEAIRKLTGGPAAKIGLPKRGLLAPDYFADFILFDPTKIADTATVENPFQYAKGIKYVYVNGQQVVDESGPLNKRAGTFISRRK